MTSRKHIASQTVHATCIAVGSQAILLLGESGSGKSDLALRLIDRGASLVSDDQVVLHKKNNTIVASPPANIKGLLEVRGVGIVKLANRSSAVVRMAVELTEKADVERFPEPEFYDCMGLRIPKLCLYPFEATSAIKVEMALKACVN